MSTFQSEFSALTRTKKDQLVKFTPKLVDRVLQLVIETPYEETSPVASPEFLSELLWKNYTESSTDSHVTLIAAGIAACGLTHAIVVPEQEQLQSLLTRLVQIYERKSTLSTHKILIVRALTTLVQHPEDPVVRRSLAPMFSIVSWRELEFRPTDDDLDDGYNTAMKKFQELSPKEKVGRLKLSSVVQMFCQELVINATTLTLTEHILNFLCLVLSQLPTRRFVKSIVDQNNVVFMLQQLNKYEELTPLIDLLKYFITFPIDEFSGEMKSVEQLKTDHTKKESLLQSTLYANHKDQLGDFLFRTSSLSSDLQKTKSELSKLSTTDIDNLLHTLKISIKGITLSTDQKVDLILENITPQLDASQILESIIPLPSTNSLLQAHNHKLSLPQLGPQYLSLSDLLLRSYQVIRADTFTTICQHILTTLPRFKKQKNQEKIHGTSRHAVLINGLTVEKKTSFATSQSISYQSSLTLDLQSSSQLSLPEWHDLTTGDVVLIGKIGEKLPKSTNPFLKEGLTALHSATIISCTNTKKTSKSITLTLSIDPTSFPDNTEENFKEMNILVKLPPRIKSYKETLDSISSIIDLNDEILPEWLLEIVLGFGDVNAGSWSNFRNGSLKLGNVNVDTLCKILDGVDVQLDKEKESKKRRVSNEGSDNLNVQSAKLEFEDESVRVSGTDCNTDLTMLSTDQLKGVISSLHEGLTVISGASGTGKRTLVSKIIELTTKNRPSERVLIVAKNSEALKTMLQMIEHNGLSSDSVFNMADTTSTTSKIDHARDELVKLLGKVDELAVAVGEDGAWGNDTETAANFYKYHIQIKWEKFLLSVKEKQDVETVTQLYPFSTYDHVDLTSTSLQDSLKSVIQHYTTISCIFENISRLAPLSYLTKSSSQSDYMLSSQARVIGTTVDQLMTQRSKLIEDGIVYHNVIVLEASQMTDFETLFPLLFNPQSTVNKLTLVGDEKNLGPAVLNDSIGEKSSLNKSLFEKFIERGIDVVRLNEVFNRGGDIVSLLKKHYPQLTSRMAEDKNIISFRVVEGQVTEHHPGFYQNIPEAESTIDAIAEMLESGVDLSELVVLTPYESQKVLLVDVAQAKLNVTPYIQTLERFRGRESKHVVLSLVHGDKILKDEYVVAALSSGTDKVVVVCCKAAKALI